MPGEVVTDGYDVPVPPGLPLAETELRVGLYDYDSGKRLPAGHSDHVKVKETDAVLR